MAQLHLHTVRSIIDGRGEIEEYIKLAVADGQTSIATTEHGNLGGIVDAYLACHKAGLNYVAGIELYVDAVGLREDKFPGHLTVLAKNESGYRALIAANNLAHRQFYYRPRLTLQQIIDNNFAENWVILSGCMSSPVHDGSFADAENIVRQLAKHSGNFFLEAMWHPSDDEQFLAKQDNYLERVAGLYKATGFPVVITNDCHYAHKHSEDIHNDLLRTSHIPSELEFDGEGFHFKTSHQMQSIAQSLGIPNAWDNAVSIGDMCKLVIPEADKINWYVPDITGGQPEAKLRSICEEMLYAMEEHGYGPEYRERYLYELSVLRTSPAILNSYLVAYDVIVWCAERNIPAAARGSMAGSLVSYLLGITREDPIKYKLSFSRAVNPARPTIPDFDLDVSSIHRSAILDYLKDRYAGNIPICAYTHYGPRGALRKILKMEGLRDQDNISELSKSLPEDWADGEFEYSPSQHSYIGTAPWFEAVPEQYRSFVATYKGVYSSLSVHPSGLLISGPERELEHEVPFNWIASSKIMASAYDMYTLKKLGLFKLDVLGLRTLDQIAYMEAISGARIPNDNYDDPEVLAAFGADLLAEIFQMDGYACRQVLKDIRGVQTFEDIIAANTLARPGCSQFTQFYRSGYTALIKEYPQVTDVLGMTNGLLLYQEQVMEVVRILADFDDAEQDDVKESIKYFRKENWKRTVEPKFASRCIAKNINPDKMAKAMADFAGYSYNRAHAMTYAAIAYKMMWYKVKFPAIFYAAVFDAAGDKSRLVLESHFFGVEWVPADVNNSEYETVIRNGKIILGLSGIKGLGPAAWETIEKNRPFTDLEDLKERVERKKCNIRIINGMKDAFALASLGEKGDHNAFREAFDFSLQFLDVDKANELRSWQASLPIDRLAGFVVSNREFTVRNGGPNHGKQMSRVTVVNSKGSKLALFFPDVWKITKTIIYEGAAVKLSGGYNTEGTFIVGGGSAE